MLVCLPRAQELLEVTVPPYLLTRDRAMHRDVVTGNVLEDAVVRRRRSPLVVLRLQPVDGYDNLQAMHADPLLRNRTDGTGHQLRVDASCRQQWENRAQLAISHQ